MGYVLLSFIAIIVVVVLVFVAATAISWYRDDQMNAGRLKTLQSDGLLSCHVDRIVPLHSRDADRRGTTMASASAVPPLPRSSASSVSTVLTRLP
jgi:hypothetical protein